MCLGKALVTSHFKGYIHHLVFVVKIEPTSVLLWLSTWSATPSPLTKSVREEKEWRWRQKCRWRRRRTRAWARRTRPRLTLQSGGESERLGKWKWKFEQVKAKVWVSESVTLSEWKWKLEQEEVGHCMLLLKIRLPVRTNSNVESNFKSKGFPEIPKYDGCFKRWDIE